MALELESLFREKAKEKEYERKTTFSTLKKSDLETVNTNKELAVCIVFKVHLKNTHFFN